jgi:hypothetical protein
MRLLRGILHAANFDRLGGTSGQSLRINSVSAAESLGARARSAKAALNIDLERIRIPDSKLAREIMELVRDTEPPMLFHHSSRV